MQQSPETLRPEGIPGAGLPGPFPVGAYAAKLREGLRARPRVQLFGEVWNLSHSRARTYFELRDASGAVPCALWRSDVDSGALADGAQVVVAGGPDYYPGSATSAPSFSFHVEEVRVAGEGDLLAQLDRLRKTLAAAGLFEPQKRLERPALPRCIGVVCAESGKARDDILAGLRRRGWAGRLVWAFAPVQDRRAAPRISAALRDLAATPEVDVVIVARGGGSLADLFCFCDESLCRTVALLRVPVIASVGHHTDRTLLDDVAAVSCSTPTHAAEAAVRVHCDEARATLRADAARLAGHARRSVLERARALARLSRAPADHVARERARLHQELRELRAAGRRHIAHEREHLARALLVLGRKAGAAGAERARGRALLPAAARGLDRAAGGSERRRRRDLERLRLAIDGHDPERALARGWSIVEDEEGAVVTSATAARAAGAVHLRFRDGRVRARVEDEEPR